MLLLAALSLASFSLSGTWQSPLGPLHVTEEKGAVTAVVAGKNDCGHKRGVVVFVGTRLDNATLAGTVNSCRLPKGVACAAGPVSGDAILLVDRASQSIKGAVHLPLGAGCSGPVTTTLKLVKQTKPPSTAAPTSKTETTKAQALQLVTEAAPLLTRTGDPEEARKKCKLASELDATLAVAHNCVGVSYYFRERFEEAMEAYNKSLEIDPSIGDTYYNIACLYTRSKPDIAMQYLTLAVANGFIDEKTQQAWATDSDLDPLRARADFQALVAP